MIKSLVLLLFLTSPALAKETRQRIVVIDSGLPANKEAICEDGNTGITGKGMNDVIGHGTNIVGIIQQHLDLTRQCIVMIKFWHTVDEWPETKKNFDMWTATVIQLAIESKPILINISMQGGLSSESERLAIIKALNLGIIVVVAAGNGDTNLTENCNSYPACYKIKHPNFHVVASYNGEFRNGKSNYGGPVTDVANGSQVEAYGTIESGTSQATAIVSGRLAHEYLESLSN